MAAAESRMPVAGRLSPVALVIGLASAATVAGIVAGDVAVRDSPATTMILAAALVPVAIIKRPAVGPLVLVIAALAIEQSQFLVGTTDPAITDRIPIFHGTSHGNDVDFLIAFVGVVWYMRVRGSAATGPAAQHVRGAMLALVGAVLLGLMVGASHHGNLRIAVTEVRPYLYLAATYGLAFALLGGRRAVHTLLWTIVIVNAVKAVQAIWIFWTIARALNPRPEAVLGHEESLFFAVSVFVPLALWLFGVPGRLRTWSTVLLPLVLLAGLFNSRRTAWLIIGVGVVVLCAVVVATRPERRRTVGRLAAVTAVIAAFYLPAFWNSTGAIGQPARAVHSAISPDPRDQLSDLYRIQENANLKINIEEGGLLGRGFGVPIDYVLPIADIKTIDPLIAYVPHDGVLYVFMRMGLAGGIAFWCVLGFGIISACRLARSANAEHAAFGAIVSTTLVAYALMGYNDQGFYFFRIAIIVGTLLGTVDATRRRDEASGELAVAR
jgi:hypothetical protein